MRRRGRGHSAGALIPRIRFLGVGSGSERQGHLSGESFSFEFVTAISQTHTPSLSLSHTHTSSTVGLCPAGASVSQHKQTPPHQVAEARATEEDAQGGSASICSPGVSPSSAQSRPPRATESRLTEQPHHTILMPVPGPLRTGDPRSRLRLPSVGASSRSITSLSGVPQARSGGSDGKETACSAGDPGSIPGSGRSPGEGNGYPLQYSCLENPMDRGAWGATVHGVTKNRTRLK